jgi:GAF domain-containing protein
LRFVSEDSFLPLGSALSELAGLLLSTETFEDLAQRVAELSVRTIGSATTCGITLAQNGRVLTVGSADALASQLDEQQYEHHTGPCLEALKIGEVVEAVDMACEDRWGVYPSVALGHGIRSVLSTPLIVNGSSVGVLNLYARDAHAFGDVDRQLALLLAGQATIAITAALRHYDEIALSEHLRTALSSRSVIDQAIGVVMAQQRCSPDEAFALLRAVSQRTNVKLREVATNLVAAIQTPS